MGKPEKVPSKPAGAGAESSAAPSAADRLLDKAQALRGPRGKYRCRKCKELPCVCPDPKQATPGPTGSPEVPVAGSAKVPVALFTEANSKRLLETAFGIPTVLTKCKLWALTDEEALELAKPAADVFNEFVTVDPKWVAVSILSVSLGTILSRKAVLYAAWKRAMKVKEGQEVQTDPAKDNPPAGHQDPPNSSPDNPEGGKTPGPTSSIEMLQ